MKSRSDVLVNIQKEQYDAVTKTIAEVPEADCVAWIWSNGDDVTKIEFMFGANASTHQANETVKILKLICEEAFVEWVPVWAFLSKAIDSKERVNGVAWPFEGKVVSVKLAPELSLFLISIDPDLEPNRKILTREPDAV